MPITLTIAGRKRRQAVMDANGEPVITYDTGAMILTASDAAAAKAYARFLVPELEDAPNATIQADGGPVQSLHDWLVAAGAVPPKAPVQPPVVKPVPHLGPIPASAPVVTPAK